MSLISDFYLKQRFFPNFLSLFINPFYFTRKGLLKSISCFKNILTGRLLDFGCGSKPYKSLFTQAIEYIGVDVENEGHNHDNEDVDFYYDGVSLPFKTESFDSVLCSEVLEHVPNIDIILDELNRVLVSEGKLLVTVPFVWPEHELPFDFRRFTVNGLTQIIENHGFEFQEVMTSGGFIEVIVQLWMMYLHNGLYGKNRYLNIVKNILFIFPVALMGIVLSFVLPKVKGVYQNVTLLAVKKD